MRITLLLFVAVVTAFIGLNLQQTEAIEEIGIFESAECAFDIPNTPVVVCGYVSVPEARDASIADDSNVIRIAVAILKSSSKEAQADPVVYLDGGPGGFTLDFTDYYARAFAPLLETRDVILFDQRGIGYSETPLLCPEIGEYSYATLADDLDDETELEQSLAIITSCRERQIASGANLLTYNSAASAADVRDIIQALGYEQVNLFGVSYGTRLALTIMRDYPDIVRSAVLDSVYPPQVDSYSEFVLNADRAFRTLFDACAASDLCNSRYPELEAVFYETVDRLEAEPEIVSFYDFWTGQDYDILVDGEMLANGLFSLMYSTEQLRLLPDAIYDAAAGDYDTFVEDLMQTLYFNNDYTSYSMFFAVECYEEVAFLDEAPFRGAFQTLPTQLQSIFLPENDFIASICAAYNDGTGAPPLENEAVVSDTPTLLLAGEYDPITPPAWARESAQSLESAYYYELPGVGHGAYFAGRCPEQIVTAFLENPLSEPDTACINNMRAPF